MNNGITIWLNGTGYWFEEARYLEEILAQNCNQFRDAAENNAGKDCMEYGDYETRVLGSHEEDLR